MAEDVVGLRELTVKVVAGYLSKNRVTTEEIPSLINSVFVAFRDVGSPVEVQAEPLKPAVSIRKSITDDHIICLEDGKKLKMLKRHLRTTYDMSPEEYRAKWGLPADYPMVAPIYAKARSQLALAAGLGRKRSVLPTEAAVVEPVVEPAAEPAKRRVGRPKKAA